MLEIQREYYNIPAEEGGWRDCYATFSVHPDTDRCDEAVLRKTETHEFFHKLGNWLNKRLPKGISVNVHQDSGQFEVFDPVRLEKEKTG